MAPKIRYDATHMQIKADESAEKEIQNVTREGIELPRCYRRPSVAPGTYPFSGFRKARTLFEAIGPEPFSICPLLQAAVTGGPPLSGAL